MKKLLFIAFAILSPSIVRAASISNFMEFYVSSSATSSNLNAGSTLGATTYWSNSGDWLTYVTSDCYHTTGADLSVVSVGQIASAYNAGQSTTSYIGKILRVDDANDIICMSRSSGTVVVVPSSAPSGVEIRVGGEWFGPDDRWAFPIEFLSANNHGGNNRASRINIKDNGIASGLSWTMPSNTTRSKGGVRIEGYKTTPGDGGMVRFISTAAAASPILTVTGIGTELWNLWFSTNGTTGSASGLVINANSCIVRNVVGSNSRGNGISVTNNNNVLEVIEVFNNNLSNTSSLAGLNINANSISLRDIYTHDNYGSNTSGVFIQNVASNEASIKNLISVNNGLYGIHFNTRQSTILMDGFDIYKNGNDGIRITPATTATGTGLKAVNGNICDNGGYGINPTASLTLYGPIVIEKVGFCSGTMANTSGDTNGIGTTNWGELRDTFSYPLNRTPWKDPDNGDFTLVMNEALSTGQGSFASVVSTFTAATGYPDIGAVSPRRKVGGFSVSQ